jgi:hypothetical protein
VIKSTIYKNITKRITQVRFFEVYCFTHYTSHKYVCRRGDLFSFGKGVYRVLSGLSSSSPSGLAKNLPLSLILRASVFYRQKLDSPKPNTLIAYETKLPTRQIMHIKKSGL